MRSTGDDRTTKARIRDAAIACVGEVGRAAMTARMVAARADVSPGSVIHHYGSMEALRAACDDHVMALIRDSDTIAIRSGPSLDVTALFREFDLGPVSAYLAAVLADDSPAVARFIDELVDNAEAYVSAAVADGLVEETDDPRGRAVVLTLWSLGPFVLHAHLRRLLGVDLLDPDRSEAAINRLSQPILELLTDGLYRHQVAATGSETATTDNARTPT